jgi:hypothetical protein
MGLSSLTRELENGMITFANVLGLFHNQKIRVYCYYCDNELTKEGAHISKEGLPYCDEPNCIKEHAKDNGLTESNFLSGKSLQKAVLNGTIKKRRNPKYIQEKTN